MQEVDSTTPPHSNKAFHQLRSEELKLQNVGIDHKRAQAEISGERYNVSDGISDEMQEFYKTHDRFGKPLEALATGVENPSTLDAQETKSPNELKGTYRGQFMQGNQDEYDATVDAYRKICDKHSGSKIHHLDNCRRFAYFARDKTTGDVRVMTDSCRQRWCPMCAGQKTKYTKEQTLAYIMRLEKPRFLTLTLRNEPGDLLPQIQFLQDCFRRLRQRAYWKKNVTGGIWFMQVKRGANSGFWHPHLHILIDGNYMEAAKISDLWDLVTFGSPIIDISCVSDPEYSAKYVARYAARPAYLSDMAVDDRIEVITALHGKRLSGTFGNAKCVTLTPPKIESDAEWEHVGYYDQVVSDSATSLSASAVLDAWKFDKPLADVHFMAYAKKDNGPKFAMNEPKKEIQYMLDFYNTS